MGRVSSDRRAESVKARFGASDAVECDKRTDRGGLDRCPRSLDPAANDPESD